MAEPLKKVALLGIDPFLAPRTPYIQPYSNPLSHILLKQTPGRTGIWGNYQFFVDPEITLGEFDAYVVFSHPKAIFSDIASTFYILEDKPTLLVGIEAFHNSQSENIIGRKELFASFDSVITNNFPIFTHNHKHSQTGYPWYTTLFNSGVDFDTLSQNNTPLENKTKKALVIASNSTNTEEHKKRFDFCTRLKHTLGDQIDFYGRGHRWFDNCFDLYKNYKYVINLENGYLPNYFTEKLADIYLCNSFPIYYGCPNIEEYFDPASYRLIDMNDIDSSIKIIDETINSTLFEQSVDVIQQQKNKVLYQYNLFNLMAEELNRLETQTRKKHAGKVRLFHNEPASLKLEFKKRLHAFRCETSSQYLKRVFEEQKRERFACKRKLEELSSTLNLYEASK